MNTHLDFAITPQPDDATCGPACLHAVYRYYAGQISVDQIIREVPQGKGGGTQAVFLGLHALRHGYEATIYTSNLQMFDPSWFGQGAPPMRERLLAQMQVKGDAKFREATQAYLDFLDLGGQVHMRDITVPLISRILRGGSPIITGLSATWLYWCKRERPADGEPDDAAGEPVGHFVVVHGLEPRARRARVADPYLREPYPGSHIYDVNVDRLIEAILLGIVTYDAKLLVVKPAARH